MEPRRQESANNGTASELPTSFLEAQGVLEELASVFLRGAGDGSLSGRGGAEMRLADVQVGYRNLVEQIPAVVFMIYLDRGIGEAYVSPQIEATLGYSQAEWLEDPVRWYRQIHPEDNRRWSLEAAEMFLTGKPLRSVYRVIARDGRVVWFHCEAKMVRRADGQPYFIQGSAFDITELKRAEEALQEERNFASAIVNTTSTLIIVLDLEGRVVRFNRPCEQATGRQFAEVRDRHVWSAFTAQDGGHFRLMFEQLLEGRAASPFETYWTTKESGPRLISWSGTVLRDAVGKARHVIASGIDITESKRLEKAILEISAREQWRIGQDLHDGLGQHLTGIAFMSKVLERKLADKSLGEAAEAAKIVQLVNEAINKTRELSRGLLPVVSDALGFMSALERWSAEVEDLFGVACRFHCDDPVLIYDDNVSTHLYRIAQEAVNNAIKHGRPKHIDISLSAEGDGIAMSIRDDGSGLPEDLRNSPGMGLHIMHYRAKMIGGTLAIERCAGGGTLVTCLLRSGIRREEEE